MQSRVLALAILVLSFAAIAKSFATKPPLAVSAGSTSATTITISNFQFSPKVLRVKAGSEVTWLVKEGTHTVTADEGAFGSQTLSPNQKFSYTFSKAGVYRYYCSFHGSKGGHDMAGRVIVTR